MLSVTNATGGVTIGATATAGVVSGLSSIITGTFTSIAGSYVTGVVNFSNVFAAAGTVGTTLYSTGGLSAGSFIGTSQSLPNFGFIGTASTTSGLPTVFINGIMSTGALPTAITLTSTAVTYSGSIAFQQPWFALCGA
jgi:hypothetical protein